jgi:hypothetical protein
MDQAKIVRKTLISIVLWLIYEILSLKNDVNVPSKSNKKKKLETFISFCRSDCHWRNEQDQEPETDPY